MFVPRRWLAASVRRGKPAPAAVGAAAGAATPLSIELAPSLLTELEKKDEIFRRQRQLANKAVKMKDYLAGLLRPGSINFRLPVHEHLHRGRPVWELTAPLKKTSGRNNTGKITVRGRGGGHKQRARLVDFHRTAAGKQTVLRIEYDPTRLAHIALVEHNDTKLVLYILALAGLRRGDVIESFRLGLPADFLAEMKANNNGEVDEALLLSRTMQKGNCMPLRMMPVGLIIHAIGLQPGGPAKFARSAGTFGRLLTKYPERNKAVVKMCLGEHRYVHIDSAATLGTVLNREHQAESLGKAGRRRYRGFRPMVRGMAMNACDHPHGGGRGKSKSNKLLQSMWGLKKFAKTRKFKNVNKLKVKDRPRR